ncbi:helix-turn-helix domain-containing protein [Streptomyces sp. NPDC058847]|uniref:helix-turn-helix domain-containing protein n=1 Tax=Streptomyces sp. NPDC058847 TaxID=3346649 RepID=UPI0036CCB02D
MATEVHRLARQLLDSELRAEELGTLLERAEAVRRELEIYTAAAVQDARYRGEKWESVAKAAHVAPETARTRWGPERVARMMILHANDKRAAPVRWRGPQQGTSGDRPDTAVDEASEVSSPAGHLASALAHLQLNSGMTIREVADFTMLSPSFISRVLSGDRLPTWDLVCTLAECFRSDPAELRVLFETAHGMTAQARQPATAAIAELHAAVRGLYWAAKSPSPEQIERASEGAVTAAEARRVLGGLDVPDWGVLAALVHALGGRPFDIKPLWEAVHYSFLMCDDPRLPEGVSHIGTQSAVG